MRNPIGGFLLFAGIIGILTVLEYGGPRHQIFPILLLSIGALILGYRSEQHEDTRERQEREKSGTPASPPPAPRELTPYEAITMHYECYLAEILERFFEEHGWVAIDDPTWRLETKDMMWFRVTQSPEANDLSVSISDCIDKKYLEEWFTNIHSLLPNGKIDVYSFFNLTDKNDLSPGFELGTYSLWQLAQQAHERGIHVPYWPRL